MRWLLVLALLACKTRDREVPEVTSDPGAEEESLAEARCATPGQPVCLADDVVDCRKDGTRGAVLQTCRDGCKAGACVETCATQGAELIYVVDTAGQLRSFDPRKLPADPFRTIGQLDCDSRSRPFSMTVDRRGIAWVLYSDGGLFRVSTVDAHCARVALDRPPDASETFGMGYVSEGPKSEEERLYVSTNYGAERLAELLTSRDPVGWRTVGPITAGQERSPELTGTGEGKLFAYFPDTTGFVQELDPATGKPIGKRLNLGPSSDVSAYAFAHWGGVFYVFTTAAGNSAVDALHRNTGKYERVLEGLPTSIVGAGVSTCAPLLERTP